MPVKDIDNEKQLLLDLAHGDHHAFDLLFFHYNPIVYSYALRICQSEFYAQEVVQEVFMKIWAARADSMRIESISAYLLVMAKNQSFLVLKRIAKEMQSNQIRQLDWTEMSRETENHLNYKETHSLLESALSCLPKQQKLVYKLCHIEGLKQQEVASRLSISRLTVKAHLRHAVKTVREIVAGSIAVLIFVISNF